MHGGITFFGSGDRRATPRLGLVFDIRWRPYGCGPLHAGTTRDISSSGIALSIAADAVPVGSLIEVQILVPALSGVLESGGIMGCLVEVTRVGVGQQGGRRILAGRFLTKPRVIRIHGS
ncbi:MAG: PilZ domain-containing protein [Sedimentisphaerales bacterium]|nr:PilZ domain-containing protein [Sedimentisphaerales bacterium]